MHTDSSFFEEFYLNEIERPFGNESVKGKLVGHFGLANTEEFYLGKPVGWPCSNGGSSKNFISDNFKQNISGFSGIGGVNSLAQQPNENLHLLSTDLNPNNNCTSNIESNSNQFMIMLGGGASEPQASKNFESFENYFSVIYNKEKEKSEDGEICDLDRKLSELRLNLEEILNQKIMDGRNVLLEDEVAFQPQNRNFLDEYPLLNEECVQNFNDLFCNENPLKENLFVNNGTATPGGGGASHQNSNHESFFTNHLRKQSSTSCFISQNTLPITHISTLKESIFDDDDQMSFQNELMKNKYYSGNKKKFNMKENIANWEELSSTKVQRIF